MDNFLTNILPEIAYALCGLVCFNTAYRGLKNEEAKYGTTVFWGLLGIIFMFGKIIPPFNCWYYYCGYGYSYTHKTSKNGCIC